MVTGETLGPYRILEKLGAGGMGEVYRAHDPRLGRDVALKVLSSALAIDLTRLERFTREARAIAALNHPHIVTIYSTEETDGVRFLTMELVEGQTLDALIPSAGLPIPRFLEIAVPLADALTAAHQKHITHRDLKPANVMIAADGRVKVLDFGLARVAAPAAADQAIEATHSLLTHEGTVLGTMPYMAPEQIEGTPADHRSDLFSLGVMFYEMLAGVRPFHGQSSPQLMSSILRDTPSPVCDRRGDVPEAVARLIDRCLEKRPEDRVQTARDVYNELRYVQKQLESGPSRRPESGSTPAQRHRSFWIAVLPFTAAPQEPDVVALAEGLTEDATAGLSCFSYLSVVAHHTARQFTGTRPDARQLGEQLGAQYVLDGTVRRAGSGVRVTARLVDTSTGAQLWMATYDRDLRASDVLSVQDDVTDRLVGTIADAYGVLVRSMTEGLHDRPVEQLTPPELTLRFWAYLRQQNATDHERVRAAFERCVGGDPGRPAAWAALAQLYCDEHLFGFNPRPDPVPRAYQAVARALELDAVHQHAWEALALAHFCAQDRDGFMHAAERAIAINPRNSNTLAWIGTWLAHMGEHDRGCELTERAMALNPDHPGWYHFAFFLRDYDRGAFEQALRAAKKVNMPKLLWFHWAIAACAGQLGRQVEACAAVDAFFELAPALADEEVHRQVAGRWKWNEETIARAMDGFRRAVALRDADRHAGSTERPPSGATSGIRTPASGSADRAGRIATSRDTAIAVLPFSSRTTDEESVLLADGLSEDIAARLSRFSHLRVIWEGTTARAARLDTQGAGRHGAARYLLEGSVRRAGSSMRVTVRLVDTDGGAHLWAESYDHDASGGVFAIQDDVTRRVVAAVGSASGVLVRAMGLALRHTPIDQLTTAELIVRFHVYLEQLRPDEHAELRAAFERAVQKEPAAAVAWACLAFLYEHEHSLHVNPLPDPLGRQRRAAERAVELDPALQYSWLALASAQFFGRDRMAFRPTVERAVSINPLSANDVVTAALYLECAGDSDRAIELFGHATALNPHHPGWYHFVPFTHEYRRGEYERALASATRINIPLLASSHFAAAAAAGQLGRIQEVLGAFTALRRIRADLLDPQRIRDHWESLRWIWDEELVARLISGFEKARALHRSDGA
jgi:eukaryotic-like serine/threonine-protein kinase